MYGIPNMKLEKRFIDRKIEVMKAEGVEFITGVNVGKDMKSAKLLKDNEYISAKGKNVIIIGGGDTGNDCVGTCIRHGAKSVTQLEMMPKAPDERTEDNPWPEWRKVCKTDYGQEEDNP